MMKKIAMILLAAGSSTRYQGNKLLEPINGKKMYRYILEASTEIIAVPRIIVTQYKEIQEKAIEYGFEVVLNQEPGLGISHSIQLGLTIAMERKPELDGVLFGVCDQPYLKPDTLKRLVAAFQDTSKNIASVSHEGKLGNPCIIGRRYFTDLYALTGDVGGKKVILRYPEDVEEVTVIDGKELSDIDFRVIV